jgi:arylsulfatase A-like enzyme
MSGLLPHETTVFENLPLPAEIEVLPEILQKKGYITAAVVSNFNLRKKTGWSRGFTIYDDTMEDYEQVRGIAERIAEHTTERAIELLKQLPKDRLFLWVHYNDPHGPYTPPSHFAEMFQNPGSQEPRNLTVNQSVSGYGGIPSYQRLGMNRDFYYYVSQYDGEIRYQDEQFERLLDTLKQLGLYDEGLIIFSSDHGEGMGEHDYYFAHGENLYNQLTHVPLIIKYGKQLIGRRKDFVQHIDIVPTILKILSLETDSRFRGRDLCKAQETNREIFAAMKSPTVTDGVKFSVVLDGLKLIYTPLDEQYELFDLKTDAYEERNLIEDGRYQQQTEDLKVRLELIRNEDFLKLDAVNKPQELTDEEREKLKSLGYVR